MANSDYITTGRGDFATIAELALDMEPLSTNLVLENFTLSSSNFFDEVRAAIKADRCAVYIDEELIQIAAIVPNSDNTKFVAYRGVADTVPAWHIKGALCWFVINSVGTDAKEYVGADEVAVKITPSTIGGGTFKVENAPPNDLTMNWRFFRPYPPGNMRWLLTERGTSHPWYRDSPFDFRESEGDLMLHWVGRDRVLQADKLVPHVDPNIGPEPGVTYTARVYDGDTVIRTEVGIVGVVGFPHTNLLSWTYPISQAVVDFDLDEFGAAKEGYIRFCSTREGFDSWQDYTITFIVSMVGQFMQVASFADIAAQQYDSTGEPELLSKGIFAASMQSMAAFPVDDEVPDAGAQPDGVFVTSLQSSAGQATSFYTKISRNLFEAPYLHLLRRGDTPVSMRVVTVAARPSDRLTDTLGLFTHEDWPKGTGSMHPYDFVDQPSFTPWITLQVKLQYLETTALVKQSSFYDGVPLTGVQVGMMALIDAEIVRVVAVAEFQITIARGCADTIPAIHKPGARMWFFEVAAGNDPRDYVWYSNTSPKGSRAEVKLIPSVYGPPLRVKDVPTDGLDFARRTERPYAPGRVMVDQRPWFEGARMQYDTSIIISWVHRNRITQGTAVVDHTMPGVPPETRQKYRLHMFITLPQEEGPPVTMTIRDQIVDGTSFEYTYEMGRADGNRGGRALGACGSVSMVMWLTSVRMKDDSYNVSSIDFESWQRYQILLSLPSYQCMPGQTPGGGQIPDYGGGEGEDGEPIDPNGTPGGNGTVGGPGPNDSTGSKDPLDNTGGSGGDGSGPPLPPEIPPDWPDPVTPPPVPGPEDPNPELAMHWDTNWDNHWDAYPTDDTGGAP